ncbi:MAG: DUF2868 domain-containing protein, partial [Desulfamplus sp.]
MNNNIKWTTGKIIDLEYFLSQDKDTNLNDEQKIKKRDRDIYLNNIYPKGVTSRRQMLLMWLEAMKKSHFDNISIYSANRKNLQNGKTEDVSLFIGDVYEEFLTILKIVFIFAGFMAGVSLCLTFFSYTGRQPLNVSYFFTLVLFPQICLLAFLAASFFISKFNTIHRTGLFPYPLAGLIIENIFMALSRRVVRKLSVEKKDAFLSAVGVIRHGEQVYGFLFFYPIFIVMQVFGMAFNVGVLLSTLFRVLFFDTAFGWQSTLQISPYIVAKIVKIAALPWGWLLPSGVGFPNIDQIVGSRIILKESIYSLTTNDLVSWWPFLSLCVLFYGFLPRFIMFIAGKLLLKRSLEEQNFDHAACSNLIERMVKADAVVKVDAVVTADAAEIKQQAVADIKPISNSDITNNREGYVRHEIKPSILFEKSIDIEELSEKPSIEQAASIPEQKIQTASIIRQKTPIELQSSILKPSILLVPDDIYNLIDMEGLNNLMKHNHGYDIKKMVVIGIDFDKEIELIASGCKNGFSIVIVQEAWQPPIRETLNFFKAVRNVINKRTPIIVALTGKAGEGDKLVRQSLFSPVEQ